MVVTIALTGARGRGKFALVDDNYAQEIKRYSWHLDRYGYAMQGGSKKKTYLHHLVMKLAGKYKKGVDVDHIDRNVLNNCSDNLRNATRSENMMNCGVRKTNSTGYKGVSFYKSKKTKPFVASITVMYIKTHIGCFETAEEAALAYNRELKCRKDIKEEFKVYNKIQT